MGILLLYNDADAHSVASLASTTNLSARELNRTVRSLVACKLLLADPALPASGDVPGEVVLMGAGESKTSKGSSGASMERFMLCYCNTFHRLTLHFKLRFS